MGVEVGNGASNSILAPSVTPDGGQGSDQGRDGLVDSGDQGELPNPISLVINHRQKW